MSLLVGTDGAHYDIPDANVEKAIASGQFSLPAAPPAAPQAAPVLPAAAPPAVATGPDVASGVVAAAPSAEVPAPPKIASLAEGATPEQVAQSEKEAHAHDAPDIQDVPLIGEDGKLYDIPDANVDAAVATGKFRVSTLEERQAAQSEAARAAEVERAGGTGLKPYVGGAADALLTGIGVHNPIAGIYEATQPKEFQETLEKAKDQVSDAHPVAYGTGAVGGEVGSAVLGGELASGVTKGVGLARAAQAGDLITSGIGRGAAKAALEGAVYSAEPVAKAIINKDPAGSAEALALGIGLNVALHGAFEGLAKLPGLAAKGAGVASEAGEALRSKYVPEYTKEQAENLLYQKTGVTPAQVARNRAEGVDIGEAFKLAGISTEDVVEGRHVAKLQALDSSGPAIGRAIKALDTLDGKAPIIEEHLANAVDRIRADLLPPEVLEHEAATASLRSAQAALKKAQPAVKEAESFAERIAARADVAEATERIASAEARLKAVGPLSEIAERAQSALTPILKQIESSAAKGTFGGAEGTQGLKKYIADQIDRTGSVGSSTSNALKKRAEGIVVESIARAEDAAGEQLGSADVVDGLRKQRQLYAIDRVFGGAADKMAARSAPEHLSHLLGGPSTGSGHMLPHALLAGLGLPHGINAALAITGIPQMVKGYIAKQGLRGAAAKVLGDSTAPTTNTVVHALERQNLQLSEAVKGFFGSLGTREAEKPLDTSGGLRGFVPDANGRSHGQQLASVQRLVTQAQTDPGAVAARLEQAVAPLRQEGLHEVAQAYTDHQLRLLKVLQAILPKDPELAQAHPFTAKVTSDEIAPATRARYQRALTIASDPAVLLHLVRNNQISQGDVAIAAAVNPSTLQKLRNEVIQEGLRAKPDLNYQQRLSMGILLGQHIDESTEQIPALQSVYAKSGAPSGPAPRKSGHLSAGASKNLASAPLTLSQHSAGHSR